MTHTQAGGSGLQLLKRVLTAVVLIPIVLVLILKAPISVLAVIAAVIALLAVHEFLTLSESYGIQPQRWPVFIYVGLFFLLLAINPGSTPLLETGSFSHSAIFAAGLAPFIFLTIAMRRADLATAFPAASVSAFAFAYVALPLAFLVQLREQWAGAFLVTYLLLVVWSGDIFAYFTGKALGRHRMSPRISPNKTWEGAVASVVASVGVGLLLYHHALAISSWLLNAHFIERRDGYFGNHPLPLWPVFWMSAALNVAAQTGDLVESLIKRGARVKDSGAILPGHGGMLDRVDALLFAAPVLWYYAAWQVMH